MNMKKYVVLVLAAVLASAVSARVSQYKISYNTVSRGETGYKSARSAWHSSMKWVERLVLSDDPSAEHLLRGAIKLELKDWNYYMFTAEMALSSADGRLRAKILESLEKDRKARPQICIDMEKTPESSLQQAKQRAKQQATNLLKPPARKKATFKTEPVSRPSSTKAEPRRLSGKMVER